MLQKTTAGWLNRKARRGLLLGGEEWQFPFGTKYFELYLTQSSGFISLGTQHLYLHQDQCIAQMLVFFLQRMYSEWCTAHY